jgi:DNA polymerase III subunit epsilon
VAIDVETASPQPWSICQIGIANFRAGSFVGTWTRHVDPQTEFHPMNMRIHRITPEMVAGQMTMREILPVIARAVKGRVVVAHSSFDRTALNQIADRLGHPRLECDWLDSVRVARAVWPELADTGYGLRNVCRQIGHDFAHHDAGADAEACGRLVLAAANRTGKGLDHWLSGLAAARPPARRKVLPGDVAINEDGHLFGAAIAFTGEMSFPRESLIEMACEAGLRVATSPSRKTAYVAVGDGHAEGVAVDERFLTGKHRRARELLAQGVNLTILDETGFLSLVNGRL